MFNMAFLSFPTSPLECEASVVEIKEDSYNHIFAYETCLQYDVVVSETSYQHNAIKIKKL